METTNSKPTDIKCLYQYPYPRNSRFYGREAEIETIQSMLSETTQAKKEQRRTSLVIDGMGGIGKSQLALEYAYRYRDSYDIILWIDCSSGTRMAISLAKAANRLSLGREKSKVSTKNSDVFNYLDHSSKATSQVVTISVLIGRFQISSDI